MNDKRPALIIGGTWLVVLVVMVALNPIMRGWPQSANNIVAGVMLVLLYGSIIGVGVWRLWRRRKTLVSDVGEFSKGLGGFLIALIGLGIFGAIALTVVMACIKVFRWAWS